MTVKGMKRSLGSVCVVTVLQRDQTLVWTTTESRHKPFNRLSV
jgi:hypothetical protein